MLICVGGRRGCREKWPPGSTGTQTVRSLSRVTTFWCPAEKHTRRRSPASPPTTRRSSLTASPSIFSVSLFQAHTYTGKILTLLQANFLLFVCVCFCARWARRFGGWVWWRLVPEPRECPADLPSWCQPGCLSVSVEAVSTTLFVCVSLKFTIQSEITLLQCINEVVVYPSQQHLFAHSSCKYLLYFSFLLPTNVHVSQTTHHLLSFVFVRSVLLILSCWNGIIHRISPKVDILMWKLCLSCVWVDHKTNKQRSQMFRALHV